MLIQKPPQFPFQAKAPEANKAQHEDPGDFINGVRIPKEDQEQREAIADGKRVLLCGICGLLECPYTREI